MVKAVIPGSFNPITSGHENLIKRASKLFDCVTVLIMINPLKIYDFSVEERREMAEKVFSKYNNVEVDTYEGLLADYVNEKQYDVIVKGIRSESDLNYEKQMSTVNKMLSGGIDTIFLVSESETDFISSSMVRQIASLNGKIKDFVPNEICDIIIKKYNN